MVGREKIALGVATVLACLAAAGCTSAPTITRVAADTIRPPYPHISADGHWVVFVATTPAAGGAVVSTLRLFDRSTKATTTLVQGDGTTSPASISADGRYVTFTSFADDLVAGDTNGHADLFTLDRTTGVITRVTDGNADTDSREASPAISADGSVIAFESRATNLVVGAGPGLFLWDRSTGTTSQPPMGRNGNDPSLSGDGRYLSATLDQGGVYRLDRQAGTWTR